MSEFINLSSACLEIEDQLQGVHGIRARNLQQLNLNTNILLKSIISSDKARERRVQFLNRIQSIVSSHFPSKRIIAHLFGSSITGLDFGGSDCDVALETAWNDEEVNVHVLARILRAAGMRNIVTIPGARVPIVKFYDPVYCISCDINVNNILGVHNSQMIKTYLSIDERVKKLIMLIKYWAKRRGINSSSSGTYSSYCYVLMAIFFLQNTNEPILPSLQEISLDLKEEKLLVPIQVNQRFKRRRKKQNSVMNYADVSYFKELDMLPFYFKKPSDLTLPSVIELFVQFCIFYSRIIQTSNSVISIRTGRLMPMKEIWANRGYLLHVEDPFDLLRNVACTASVYGEKRLVHEMKRVIGLFQAGNCTLETLFEKIDERSLELEDKQIINTIGVAELISNLQRSSVPSRKDDIKPIVSNGPKKPKKLRNKEAPKSSSRSKADTPQIIREYSLHATTTPPTHTIGLIETVEIEPQISDLPVKKEVTKPVVKGNLRKVKKDPTPGPNLLSSSDKVKTPRKIKSPLELKDEPISHSIGLMWTMEDEQEQLILSRSQGITKSTDGNQSKGVKQNHSQVSTKPLHRVKARRHTSDNNSTIDELINGLSALNVGENPPVARKKKPESRSNPSNHKAKRPTNPDSAMKQNKQVTEQTTASFTTAPPSQAPKPNKRIGNLITTNSGPITPPTSDEDRHNKTPTDTAQSSKTSSHLSRSQKGNKGTKRGPRSKKGFVAIE